MKIQYSQKFKLKFYSGRGFDVRLQNKKYIKFFNLKLKLKIFR